MNVEFYVIYVEHSDPKWAHVDVDGYLKGSGWSKKEVKDIEKANRYPTFKGADMASDKLKWNYSLRSPKPKIETRKYVGTVERVEL
jgi:hypothetical protein